MYELYDRDSEALLAKVTLRESSDQDKRHEFQIVNGYRNMWRAWHKSNTFIVKQENKTRLIQITGFPSSKADPGRFTFVAS